MPKEADQKNPYLCLIIDNHDFHMEKKRTKRIHGNRLYYLKDDWDAARKIAERNSASTKAKREQ